MMKAESPEFGVRTRDRQIRQENEPKTCLGCAFCNLIEKCDTHAPKRQTPNAKRREPITELLGQNQNQAKAKTSQLTNFLCPIACPKDRPTRHPPPPIGDPVMNESNIPMLCVETEKYINKKSGSKRTKKRIKIIKNASVHCIGKWLMQWPRVGCY